MDSGPNRKREVIRQWQQLMALTFAHTVVDLFVGMLTPLLIPMQNWYGVSLSALIFVVTMKGFSSNVLQIPCGLIRPGKGKPHLIAIALVFAGCATWIPNLPRGRMAIPLMILCAIVAGFGTALLHPIGLRALQGLDRIASSLSTSIFMVAGFSGFAGGAWLSATLVQHFGLSSVFLLCTLVPLAAAAVYATGVRLHLDNEHPVRSPSDPNAAFPKLPFVPLFLLASFTATSSQIQSVLLPSYLHDTVGYSLSFSGFSFAMYGIGSMIGAVVWGAAASRAGIVRLLTVFPFLGVLFTTLYLWAIPHGRWATPLLAMAGFTAYTVFPLSITLARYSASRLPLGVRMGLMSGGSWSLAAMSMWVISPFADPQQGIGFRPFLHLVWVGYLVAGCVAFGTARAAAPRTEHQA